MQDAEVFSFSDTQSGRTSADGHGKAAVADPKALKPTDKRKREALRDKALPVAALLKVLGNEHRFQILCALSDKECTVSELGQSINISQPALSQHLMRLRDMNLVTTRRVGTFVCYSLDRANPVEPILSSLQEIFVD